MSTRNIPQLPQIRGQLQATAGHVRDRSRQVRAKLEELDRTEDDVRVGTAAVLQSIDDDRAESLEEAEQLAAILRQAAGVESSGDVSETSPRENSDASATVFDQDEEGTEPPAAREAPRSEPAVVSPPTEVVVVTPRRNHSDPREWQDAPLAWILAILGALIGIVVASNTWEDVVDDLDGFARSLIATLWWIGIVGIGFFGGGTLGSWLSCRFRRD